MRRDMELIRMMVLAIEDHTSGWAPDLNFEGYTPAQIGYHAYLLVNAGLADGVDGTCSDSSGPEWEIQHLTSAGHDFADSIRNEYIWDEVKNAMKEKGLVSATIEVVKKLLDKQIRKRLELD